MNANEPYTQITFIVFFFEGSVGIVPIGDTSEYKERR